jgi:arabinofuranosyltransferase
VGRIGTVNFVWMAALSAALVFLVTVVRLGWLSDDAFIAMRAAEHLARGHGLTVNIDQRVQSFTSPLAALLLSLLFVITRNPYASLMALGLLATTALAVWLLWAGRRTPVTTTFVFVFLASSFAFTSFSTSGLENPLAHLLLAVFAVECLNGEKRRASPLALYAAAAILLTRLDLALLILPALVVFLRRAGRPVWRHAAIAAVVVMAWFSFATFYYGFPWPNTAYAKLNTAIPFGDRTSQGLSYLVDTLCRDPVVVALILLGVLGVMRPGASVVERALGAGLAAYVGYVVLIGGDFMSGRFLTAPFLVAVLLVATCLEQAPAALSWGGIAVGLWLSLQGWTDRRAERFQSDCHVPASGIVDERECYVIDTGLPANLRAQKWRGHGYLNDFRRGVPPNDRVVVFDLVGLAGYANDDEKHIVERFALTDPLLARIRLRPGSGWRPGHFFRDLPPGYLESLKEGRNVIPDPCIHDLYDKLALVTTGPLFRPGRIAAILALNFRDITCAAP